MKYKIESDITYDEAIKLMNESKEKWWPNSPMYYAHLLAIKSLKECKQAIWGNMSNKKGEWKMYNPRINVSLREEIAKHINKIVVEATLHGGDDGPYYSNTKDLYNEMKDFQIKFLGTEYDVEIISDIPVFVRNKNSIDPILEPYDKLIEAHKKLLNEKGI